MSSTLCAIAVQQGYGLHDFWAIVCAHLLLNIPFAWYLLHSAYTALDYTVVCMAYDLGASPWQCYRTTIVPLLLPTIRMASAVIFILCFCSHAIPLVVAHGSIYYTPTCMIQSAYAHNDWQSVWWYWAARLCIVLPLGYYATAIQTVQAHGPHIPIDPHTVVHNRTVGSRLTSALVLLCSMLFFVVPLTALGYHAYDAGACRFIVGALGRQDVLVVVRNTLFVAGVSSISALCIGTLLALMVCCLQKTEQSRGYYSYIVKLLYGVVYVPLLCGGVGSGILFAWWTGTLGGSSWTALIASHILLTYPFVYRMVSARMSVYAHERALLARSLGATSVQVLRTVVLPCIRPTLYNAWVVVFGFCLTQLGASMATNTMTVKRLIRISYQQGDMAAVYGLSFLLLIIVGGVRIAVSRYGHVD